MVGQALTDRMGIPLVAVFHYQTENVTYSMELGWFEAVHPYSIENIVIKAENMYNGAVEDYRKSHPSLFGINQIKKPYVPKISSVPIF
ncbi:MAG: hypothetical protein JXB50_16260 [Spirochaetes bacterium]|nr:hypothetical protein [Spirochaetota bacterium]